MMLTIRIDRDAGTSMIGVHIMSVVHRGGCIENFSNWVSR